MNAPRLPAALAALTVGSALLLAILIGLGVHVARVPQPSIAAFDVTLPPPPPPATPEPAKVAAKQVEGAAAPAAPVARPRPVTAPTPRVEIPEPPETAPPVAGEGPDDAAGASDRPGPGTGAGGSGDGLGSGGAGNGIGSGGIVTPAKRIRGGIDDRDYPRAAAKAGAGGRVIVHLSVGTDGRVNGCRVALSSGNAELDSTTCKLAKKRFRYTPARDAAGRAVPDVAGWQQDWWLAPRR